MWYLHAMLADAREQELRREIRARRWLAIDRFRPDRLRRRRARTPEDRRVG